MSPFLLPCARPAAQGPLGVWVNTVLGGQMSNCDPHSRSPCTGLDQTPSGAIDSWLLSISRG